MDRIAKRDDWKAIVMPDSRSTIAFTRQYSDREFGRLSAGLIPREMEDKWFIYYEEPDLYLHRSWTGYCVYQVRFHPDGRFFSATSAVVNRDASQYTETVDEYDTMLLGILMDQRAGRDTEKQWKTYSAAKRGA